MTGLLAHGIAAGADVPIPMTVAAAAAAFVLVLSFGVLAFGWTRPRLRAWQRPATGSLPRPLEVALGFAGVAAFAVVAYAGLAGTALPNENLAPTAVYVGFWVGLAFASLLLGDVFKYVSPWRAVGRAAGWVGGRLGLASDPLAYPERLGRLPAAVGLFAFAVCELCWTAAGEPRALAILMLVYFVAMLVGMSLFGVEPWLRHGDAFGVLFGLFGARGRVDARVAGTVALLLVAIGSTAFDGAREAAALRPLTEALEDVGVSLGLPSDLALETGRVVLLALCVAIVVAIWLAGIAPVRRHARAFTHTLIPIAAGYLVAHYFSLAVVGGQALWPLANDPLGAGADLFGGAAAQIDYAALSTDLIWWVQIIALVAGHVAALVLAHDRALEVYGDARAAARSQMAMLGLMVVFTSLGLWLLSAGFSA
ncbi:fenitrothion hydrolase [Solirubrobacter sp. CPCC 204708]|uniref:Fenitrothion hydrolase n=1 Tax=Solirubrobacter deserti TaxID=2282478 RepID=A0ABT4RTF0_9ACTN|nr:fenitrothion hydrolase [Solirubrobacter deserti]MBE2320753.1 fenitrothion hydrolase [Solirubrobacter deserti]MDA0141855.1 fenitrothion hydrolase [Solirubrobacter deserti]